jgi:hypothetical protein
MTAMLPRVSATILVLLFLPAPAFAWGAAAHRYIMGKAIDLLPAGIKPFFEQHRAEVVLRVNDPDTWRVAGWDEGSHHSMRRATPFFLRRSRATISRTRTCRFTPATTTMAS